MGPALEVAIGLSVMFFIIALAASSIVEFVGTLFKLREKGLERTISKMLGAPDIVEKKVDDAEKKVDADKESVNVAGEFFSSSTIVALKEAETAWTILGGPKKSTRLLLSKWRIATKRMSPARIPARAFADVVVDVLTKEGRKILTKEGKEAGPDLFDRLPCDLQGVLRPMLDETENDLVALKAKLEQWFDDSMRGMTEMYKLWAKKLLFIVSLVLAGILNASVFHVADKLWSDPTTRVAVVQVVDELVKGSADKPPTVELVAKMVKQITESDTVQIPLGWDGIDFPVTWWVLSIVGWLATALLATLGAPFWYDAMLQLSSRRKLTAPLATEDPASATSLIRQEPDRKLFGQRSSERSEPTPKSDPAKRLLDALPLK